MADHIGIWTVIDHISGPPTRNGRSRRYMGGHRPYSRDTGPEWQTTPEYGRSSTIFQEYWHRTADHAGIWTVIDHIPGPPARNDESLVYGRSSTIFQGHQPGTTNHRNMHIPVTSARNNKSPIYGRSSTIFQEHWPRTTNHWFMDGHRPYYQNDKSRQYMDGHRPYSKAVPAHFLIQPPGRDNNGRS